MSGSTQMILGVFMLPPGHHIGAWRMPGTPAGLARGLGPHLALTQTAERGLLDMVFLADTSAVPRGTAEELSYNGNRTFQFEPTTVISALGALTRHIGLIATMSTTYNEPWTVARKFATLDHLTGGRVGWNLVTSRRDEEGQNFNRDAHMIHAERYERAREFIEVARGLWDSWDDDAIIEDKASGHFFRPEGMHVLDHRGKHFQVRGPLNVARSPQGHPVVVQAGSSGVGRQLAAETAELIFTAQNNIADAVAFRSDVRARAAAIGRDPDGLRILPGLSVVVGRSAAEAEEKFEALQQQIHPVPGLAHVSELIGDFDLSRFPLDGPLPEIPPTNASTTRQRLLIEMARRENLTIRQLYMRIAGNRAHAAISGTPAQIVDQMAGWIEAGACDGFNLIPPDWQALPDFVDHVVPELQRRGLFRTAYAPGTLRDRLGMTRPARGGAAWPGLADSLVTVET